MLSCCKPCSVVDLLHKKLTFYNPQCPLLTKLVADNSLFIHNDVDLICKLFTLVNNVCIVTVDLGMESEFTCNLSSKIG